MWIAEDRALVGDYGSGQALSDDRYRLLEPFIPPARPGGRPRTTDIRRLLDGLFYVVRTGCQWRHLPPPPAFPPWPTVYGYFRAQDEHLRDFYRRAGFDLPSRPMSVGLAGGAIVDIQTEPHAEQQMFALTLNAWQKRALP